MTKIQKTMIKGWVVDYPHSNMFWHEMPFICQNGDWLYVFMTAKLREAFEELLTPNRHLALTGELVREAEEFNLKHAQLEYPQGPRLLPGFDDYTVDFKLKEFRLVSKGKIDFISFGSAEGQELMSLFQQHLRQEEMKRHRSQNE